MDPLEEFSKVTGLPTDLIASALLEFSYLPGQPIFVNKVGRLSPKILIEKYGASDDKNKNVILSGGDIISWKNGKILLYLLLIIFFLVGFVVLPILGQIHVEFTLDVGAWLFERKLEYVDILLEYTDIFRNYYTKQVSLPVLGALQGQNTAIYAIAQFNLFKTGNAFVDLKNIINHICGGNLILLVPIVIQHYKSLNEAVDKFKKAKNVNEKAFYILYFLQKFLQIWIPHFILTDFIPARTILSNKGIFNIEIPGVPKLENASAALAVASIEQNGAASTQNTAALASRGRGRSAADTSLVPRGRLPARTATTGRAGSKKRSATPRKGMGGGLIEIGDHNFSGGGIFSDGDFFSKETWECGVYYLPSLAICTVTIGLILLAIIEVGKYVGNYVLDLKFGFLQNFSLKDVYKYATLPATLEYLTNGGYSKIKSFFNLFLNALREAKGLLTQQELANMAKSKDEQVKDLYLESLLNWRIEKDEKGNKKYLYKGKEASDQMLKTQLDRPENDFIKFQAQVAVSHEKQLDLFTKDPQNMARLHAFTSFLISMLKYSLSSAAVFAKFYHKIILGVCFILRGKSASEAAKIIDLQKSVVEMLKELKGNSAFDKIKKEEDKKVAEAKKASPPKAGPLGAPGAPPNAVKLPTPVNLLKPGPPANAVRLPTPPNALKQSPRKLAMGLVTNGQTIFDMVGLPRSASEEQVEARFNQMTDLLYGQTRYLEKLDAAYEKYLETL